MGNIHFPTSPSPGNRQISWPRTLHAGFPDPGRATVIERELFGHARQQGGVSGNLVGSQVLTVTYRSPDAYIIDYAQPHDLTYVAIALCLVVPLATPQPSTRNVFPLRHRKIGRN